MTDMEKLRAAHQLIKDEIVHLKDIEIEFMAHLREQRDRLRSIRDMIILPIPATGQTARSDGTD